MGINGAYVLAVCAASLFCIAAANPSPAPTAATLEPIYTMPPIPTPTAEPNYTLPPIPPPTPSTPPASGLRIAWFRVITFVWPGSGWHPQYNGPWTVTVCADVTNTSPRNITHFQIVFTDINKDGEPTNDALDVRNNIASGATLKNSCRFITAQTVPDVGESPDDLFRNDPGSWRIGPDTVSSYAIFNDKSMPVIANITEVDFAGAPSWHAPTRP